MVKAQINRKIFGLLILLGSFGLATPCFALFHQTREDLNVLEDQLRTKIEADPDFKGAVTPTLVGTPIHHWKESREDFGSASEELLRKLFPEPTSLIQCTDCNSWRLHARNDQSLMVLNGELSIAELGRIRQDPRYINAKTLTLLKETPQGVEMKIISLNDGRLIFNTLADSSQTLDDIQPYQHLQVEKERRLRGESLYYTFVNLGVWPRFLMQLEFVEQWGERNQHISGVGLSLGDDLAIGGVYHYMLPRFRKLHFSGALYMPIQDAVASKKEGLENSIFLQGQVQYTFARSFGLFGSIDSKGRLSMGFNFYNPLLLPIFL